MDEPTPSIPWSATLMVTGESRELAMEMLRGLLIAIEMRGANESIFFHRRCGWSRCHHLPAGGGAILASGDERRCAPMDVLTFDSVFTTGQSRLPTRGPR